MSNITLPNGSQVACLNRQNTLDLYAEIFTHNIYGMTGVQIHDGDTVFDVGANIGLFAIWALSRAVCHLHCFEPSPTTYDVLRRNVPGAICIPAAVTDHCGTICLTHYPRLPELSTVRPGDFADEERKDWTTYLRRRAAEHGFYGWIPATLRNWLVELKRRWLFRSETVSVPCVTLESALRDHEKIDLLKIDVEKSELAVLLGLGLAWAKIKQIIVESYGDGWLMGKIEHLLTSHGFTTKWHRNPMFPELQTPLVFGVR